MDIQVVLTQDDPKLGKRGQVIKVSSGYAQNYLIPHQKAKLATPSALKSFQEEQARHARQEAENLAQARELAKKISGTSLNIEMLVGEGEKLYGAVTNQDIHEALFKQGVTVDRKDIHLEEPIKKLGAYEVSIKLHPEVSTKLKLWVLKKKNA